MTLGDGLEVSTAPSTTVGEDVEAGPRMEMEKEPGSMWDAPLLGEDHESDIGLELGPIDRRVNV